MKTLQDSSNYPERKTAIVSKILEQYHIDIAALSETRLPGSGQLTEFSGGYTFYWVGLSKEERRQAGVGFAIKTKLASNLISLPVAINERLMTFRLPLAVNRHATVISAYAPTMISPDEIKEKFYKELHAVISKIPSTDLAQGFGKTWDW